MTTLDRARFAKVIALAESDQDGEALAAVRKAAKMARAAGLTLGQAVEAGHGKADRSDDGEATRLTIKLAEAVLRITDLEKEIQALRRRGNEVAPEAWGRGFVAGKEQGYNEAFGRIEHERSGFRHQIEALEAELEGYRPPFDWQSLAKAFAAEGARWNSATAKALAARARRGELTVEDKITLRHFASKSTA